MTKSPRNQIREFLENLCHGKLRDDEPIFSSGRISSLGAIQLMLFLEEQFDLDTADPDFDAEMLDSIDEIVALLPGVAD